MSMEEFREREHGIADLVVLLAVMCLALATWLYLPDPVHVPLWKSYTSVAVTVILGLAALTRQPRWTASIRLLTGGWMMAVPYLLDFAQVSPALRAYLATGAVVATVSALGVFSVRRLAGPNAA